MSELKKVLSFKVILLITINSIMGTGIFFLPSIGAQKAGPASLISWSIMSLIAVYVGMCFAELTSMFPKEGGVFEFCKHAYGRFWSFVIGWLTFVVSNITIAMLVVGAIHYLLPAELPLLKLAISLVFVLIFNTVAYFGMKTSAYMLVAFAIITLGTLLSLIVPGLLSFQASNLVPFFVTPISSIFVTVFFIAETFFGWETATFLAGETKNGETAVPKALVIGTMVIGIICMLFVLTSLGTINWQVFGASTAPLTDLGRIHFGAFGAKTFTILVYLSIIGSVAGWIVASPRLLLAMAKDKLFLSQFSFVHPKYNTPSRAIVFQAIVTSIVVVIATGSYNTLLSLLVPLVLIMYSAVLLSLVVLRIKKPYLKRHYRVVFGKSGPLLIILFNAFLMFMWLRYSSGASSLLLALSFILLGIPLYLLIELYYNPKAIMKASDSTAKLHLMFESITLPKYICKEILMLLGDIGGKRVLEFGCHIGTLTLHLAEEVGSGGKVYATNLSENELRITEERLEKKRRRGRVLSNVELIFDIEHTHRVHPSVGYVDAAVSVGMLGYLTEMKRILKELNELLPDNGRICFVEYINHFHLLPDIEWLTSEEGIRALFREAGFSVRVKKKRGLFWNYLFIYGMKSKGDYAYI